MRRLTEQLFLVATAAVLGSLPALAHPLNVGVADITIRETAIEVLLSVNLFELDLLLSLDRDLDARVEPDEVQAKRREIVAYLAGRVSVVTDDGPLTPDVGDLQVRESADGKPTLETTVRFRAGRPFRTFTIRCEPLAELGADHKTIARISRDGRSEPFVFEHGVPYEGRERSFLAYAGQFLGLGVHHIFIGYDHIAFLLALMLTSATWLRVVAIVTSFTLAHSLTLSLAVLEIVSLPARLVEAGIAFSVAYVAMENLVLKTHARRWLVSGFFGFVHGFGFASVLREMPLSRSGRAASLLFFNVGVEFGQILIISALLPLLWLLARTAAYPATVKAASLAIFVAGTVWFFQRVL